MADRSQSIEHQARRTSRTVKWTTVCGIAATALATGCASTGVGGMVLSAGRALLQNIASDNYASSYADTLEQMLALLEQPTTIPSSNGTGGVGLDIGSLGIGPSSLAEGGGEHTSAADSSAGGGEPLGLDVALIREVAVAGRAKALPIVDGETLRDGVGRSESGDNFKIRIRPSTDCYVYVVALDATAWAEPLFPASRWYAHENPVHAGTEIEFPAGDEWFHLDGHRGVETFYFLASRTQQTELASVLGELLAHDRPPLEASDPQPVTEPVIVTRGIGGVRPTTTTGVVTSDRASHDVVSQLFEGQREAGNLVITRWFLHE